MTSDAALVVNSAAGRVRRKTFTACLRRLERAGYRVELLLPSSAEEMARAGQRLASRKLERIILAGGDGTLGTFLSRVDLDRVPPIGLLPFGTANVVARDLDLSLDPLLALEQVLRGKVQRINVGVIEYDSGKKERFVLSVGVGLSSDVVRSVNLEWKRRIGRVAYGIAFWRERGKWRRDVPIRIGRKRYEVEHAVILAARRYAGGYRPGKTSQPGDRILEGYLFPRGVLVGKALGRLVTGKGWEEMDGILSVRARKIRIESDVPMERDGDPAGVGPATVRIEGTARLLKGVIPAV